MFGKNKKVRTITSAATPESVKEDRAKIFSALEGEGKGKSLYSAIRVRKKGLNLEDGPREKNELEKRNL